jgi:hypothetical protein
MSLLRGPKLITEGLVVALDSIDPISYPGSGTTWYDLSGNNNNGTMYNFTGPNAGSTSGYDTNTKLMMFDRHVGSGDGTANNYVLIANSTSLQDCLCQNGMTVCMWLKVTSAVCTAMTKWNNSWEIYYCSNLVFRTQGTNGNDGVSSYVSTSYVNAWSSIVCTHDGTTRKIYFNGSQIFSDTNSVTAQDTTNALSVGAYNGGSYAFVGAMPCYHLYSRALTATEVLQNYNSMKSRFGL